MALLRCCDDSLTLIEWSVLYPISSCCSLALLILSEEMVINPTSIVDARYTDPMYKPVANSKRLSWLVSTIGSDTRIIVKNYSWSSFHR